MVSVSKKAQEMIRKTLESREEKIPVRLVYSGGGWTGPSLEMSLDEAKETDKVFNEDDITFIIDEQLLEQVKPVNIDFISTDRGSGFSITSGLSGGSCGGSCCGC